VINWLTWVLIGLAAGLTIMQIAFVWWYQRDKINNESLPTEGKGFSGGPDSFATAVVLCLRGLDPSVLLCVQALLKLDHPNFELHLVVDSPDDPAVEPLRSLLVDSKIPVTWHTLTNHAKHRSLKCSAILAAIEQLAPEIEVVALVDADVIVPPNWLQKLTGPLANPEVGAASGSRWFEPEGAGVGETLRKIWTAAALPQMSMYHIAWGGSLAIRTDVIDRCRLRELWSDAFCEDTMLAESLAAEQLRVQLVDDLILTNRESTGFGDACRWITRQLLTVRLHHSNWYAVAAHGLIGGVCFYGMPLLAIVSFLFGPPVASVLLMVGWLVQLVVNVWLVRWIELTNNRRSGEELSSTAQTTSSPRGVFTNFVLQAIYPGLVIGSACCKAVSWRGIRYRILPRGKIEMQEFKPYAELQSTAGCDDRPSLNSIH
jgi:hypothetical protein